MNMIPKIIHYCWFGQGEMPDKIKKCLNSWKAKLPDYEIKLWNEQTFDVEITAFTKEAYLCKKYAFVSDYVRFWALHKYGGVYLDTDVEIVQAFNELLDNEFFCCMEGEKIIATCVIAAKPEHELCARMLDYYKERHFCVDTKMDMKPNTLILSKEIMNLYGSLSVGVHEHRDLICIYSKDYFHPLDSISNKLELTENTYAIHWHTALWVDSGKFKFKKIIRTKILVPLLGERLYKKIYSKILKKKIDY